MRKRDFLKEVKLRNPKKRLESGRDIYLSLRDIDEITKMIFGTIIDLVAVGEEVKIEGFGKFLTEKSEDRIGTNPNTHEKMIIKGKIKPKFVPYNEFKKEVDF